MGGMEIVGDAKRWKLEKNIKSVLDRVLAPPTEHPTALPSQMPSQYPTEQPTSMPSQQPSQQPSTQPTLVPTTVPTSSPRRQQLRLSGTTQPRRGARANRHGVTKGRNTMGATLLPTPRSRGAVFRAPKLASKGGSGFSPTPGTGVPQPW